ncbi:unnamed protein product [Clonostachys rosea]|uniref:Heterokaryon incompatibility domain-containing protein n=1 Tax=Bionectria ochroleuca TaxID=29856 RepID=A0ABY6UYK2_BIOOC|nr:unnamed protein product [Clonostachys rosea]
MNSGSELGDLPPRSPSFHDTLCGYCRHIDLGPLLAGPKPSSISSSEPASAYEDKAAIFVGRFAPKNPLKFHSCSLCGLLVECANRTGATDRLSSVRCCLRPKLRWSYTAVSDSAGKRALESRLEHSGQILVWFQELEDPQPVGKEYREPSAKSVRRRLFAAVRDFADAKRRDVLEFRHPSIQLRHHLMQLRPQPPEVPELDSVTASDSHNGNGRDKVPEPEPSALQVDTELIGDMSSGDERSLVEPVPTKGIESVPPRAVAPWMIDIIKLNSISPITERAPIPPIADSGLLRQWLYECSSQHLHPQEPLDQHSRIGEVLRRGVLRAINTTTGRIETQDALVPFVALSYVWGQTVHLTPSLESKPVADYAPSIRDAAELARSMDVAWLWVDRMCINQSSEEEKSFLIPYIKDIFAAAQLTIISAAGDGAHDGLPGTSKTPREKERILEVMNGPEKFALLPSQPSFNALYEPCVWRRRGWTFEEQVFSSRVLYIFPTEMLFSCCKGTFRESSRLRFSFGAAGSVWGDNGATPPIVAAEINAKIYSSLPNSSHSLSARDFVRAVEEYTSRSLTVEEDRVIAFAGLITLSAGDKFPERALLKHGHPPDFFETALTWQHDEDFEKRQPRNGKPFAPSWSWASAGTKVHFLDNGGENGRSSFFDFSCPEGYDVLALPTKSFYVPKRLALTGLQDILQSQPWTRNCGAPLSSHGAANPFLQLPTLHLVTVAFCGNLIRERKDVHSLVSLVDSDRQNAPLQGRWSVDTASRTSIGLPVKKLFAIVAGNLNIFVMALHPTSEENTYTRNGLFPVSVSSHRTLFAIMRGGNPRWQCISIV